MRHLKEVRPMTTHKTIVELIKEGKIKMVKDKPYSQTDFLVINESNEFNKIYNELRETENFMNDMDWFIHYWAKQDVEYDFDDQDASTVLTYADITELKLRILLLRINDKIRSENDSKLLYTKLIKLMLLLDNQAFYRRQTGKYETDYLNFELKTLKETLYDEANIKVKPKHVELGNRLLEDIERFKKEFVT